ncbi:MAG: hypothetical protein Q9199_001985 [Rusavskia elegans]
MAQTPLSPQVSVSAGIQSKVLALAGLRVDDVEDILPCLAGQVFHLMTWLKSGRTRSEATFSYRCREPLDPTRLLNAWRTLRQRHPILRTVFISSSGTEVMQAVLRPAAIRSDGFQCIGYWAGDEDTTDRVVMQIAAGRFDSFSPPVELFLAQCTAGYDILVLKLHHALYDAWTIDLIIHELCTLYEGKGPSPILHSTTLIREMLRSSAAESSRDYWRNSLAGCQKTILTTTNRPARGLPLRDRRSRRSFFFVRRAVHGLHQWECRCHQSNTWLPTLILLAFSRSLAELTFVKSPTFGAYHIDRSSHVAGLNRSLLPYMTMTPVMIREPLTRGLRSSVENLESDFAARLPFQQSHLYDIFDFIGRERKPLFNTFISILWPQETDSGPEDKSKALLAPADQEYVAPSERLPGRTSVDGLNTSFLADGNLFLDVQTHRSRDELRLSVRCDREVLNEEEAKMFLGRIEEEIGKCIEEAQGKEREE